MTASAERVGCAALAAIVTGVAGCDNTQPPQLCGDQEFALALRHAQVPTAADVDTHLIAITPSNTTLERDASGRVRMAQWTDFGGYQIGDNVLGIDVFVAVGAELRGRCAGLRPEDTPPRLNQILGLPPEADPARRRVVQLFVRPEDLFRPCPDAEIDDTTCGLAFPANVTPAYREWFDKQYAESFGYWQKRHFPFTGLGYTYDWCNVATREGPSEFVARQGSTVVVASIQEASAYCSGP